MSEKIGNITLIYAEEPQECDDCGKIDELRPYGPNGSKVCYECAMKDPVGSHIRMCKILYGENVTEEEAIKQLKKMGKIK